MLTGEQRSRILGLGDRLADHKKHRVDDWNSSTFGVRPVGAGLHTEQVAGVGELRRPVHDSIFAVDDDRSLHQLICDRFAQ